MSLLFLQVFRMDPDSIESLDTYLDPDPDLPKMPGSMNMDLKHCISPTCSITDYSDTFLNL